MEVLPFDDEELEGERTGRSAIEAAGAATVIVRPAVTLAFGLRCAGSNCMGSEVACELTVSKRSLAAEAGLVGSGMVAAGRGGETGAAL